MKTFIFVTLFIFIIIFLPVTSHTADNNACLNCHVSLKEPAKHVHKVMNMACELCHEPVQGKDHPKQKDSMKLNQKMPGLCFTCHKEARFKGKSTHAPVSGGMCTGCHDAHQSNFPSLLKKESPEVCYNCHDKSKFNKKVIHMAIPAVGCNTCHAPHASDHPTLLADDINPLCLSCHKSKASGRHVVAIPGGKHHPLRGRPDPSNPKRELSCVSCHDPHSTDYENLFYSERMCVRCHKEF